MKRILFAFALLFMVQACAGIIAPPGPPPLAPGQIEERLAFLREQQARVETFYAYGSLQARRYLSRSESTILIAGTRNPFRIKIELTHPWGQPLLHLLIEEEDVRVLCPPEKRLYVGSIRDAALSKYLPGALEPDQLWGLLRGLPAPVPFQRAVPGEDEQINLTDERGEVKQSILLDPLTRNPARVIYPDRGITVDFSGFTELDGLLYAAEVTLADSQNGVRVERQVRQMVMNRPVPDAVFTLAVPTGYETLPLKQD